MANERTCKVPADVVLEDAQVRLRAYQESDVEALHEAVRESIDAMGRWLPWCASDYALRDSREWISSRAAAWQSACEYSFAVVDRATGKLIGGCGLNQFDWTSRRANLGYWVRTSRCGSGHATAAARLLARFALDRLELERIEIVAAEGNVPSQRVAVKVGATRECLARHRLRVRGVQHDAFVFSIVRGDPV